MPSTARQRLHSQARGWRWLWRVGLLDEGLHAVQDPVDAEHELFVLRGAGRFVARVGGPGDPVQPRIGPIVEAASFFTTALMFIPYISTAFVPARTMPGVLRGFADNQPYTPIVETMRGLWMGHTATGVPASHDAFLAVAWCVGILAVSIAGASWLFRHRTAA